LNSYHDVDDLHHENVYDYGLYLSSNDNGHAYDADNCDDGDDNILLDRNKNHTQYEADNYFPATIHGS
jgi:hypothetical protein